MNYIFSNILKKLSVWQPKNPPHSTSWCTWVSSFLSWKVSFLWQFPLEIARPWSNLVNLIKTHCTTLNLEEITQRYVTWTMCFAESSCVFQASELTKRHSNNQFVTFVLLVLAAKDNHEFHTNSNKFISINLKRSGAAMCVSALILSFWIKQIYLFRLP